MRLSGISRAITNNSLTVLALGSLMMSHAASADKIMAIGDSITASSSARTYSFSDSDFPASAYRNEAGGLPGNLRSYREHLHDLLLDASCNAEDVTWVGAQRNSNRVPEFHEGHSGWRVDQLLTRTWPAQGTTSPENDLDGWLSVYSPDVVLIHAGTNDMLQETDANNVGVTAASTAAELSQLLDKVFAQNVDMTVLVANVTPIYGWYADHQNVAPYPLLSVDNANELEAAVLSAEIEAMVASRPSSEDIHLVDVRSGFFVDESDVVSCPASTGGNPLNHSMTQCRSTGGDDFPDGIHPSIWGDNHIANQFYDVIFNDTDICRTSGNVLDETVPDSQVDADPGDLSAGTVTFTGTATDNSSGVESVRVRIRRNSDNLYYSGSAWVSSVSSWLLATGTNNWSIDLPVTEGDYKLWAYAQDNAGNIERWQDGRDAEDFTIGVTGGADTTVPDSDVDADPGNLTAGIVSFTGTATDDSSGVESVRVRIRRDSDNLYYSGSAWVSSVSSWLLATGTNNWSIDLPVDEGGYKLWAYAQDNAGNIERWPDGRDAEDFTIGVTGGADTTVPDSDVEPDPGNLTAGIVSLTGTATDNSSGVESVRVRIRRNSDNLYYSGSAWVSSVSSWLLATGTNDWSIDLPVDEGGYKVWAYAQDHAGNIEGWPDGRDAEDFEIGVEVLGVADLYVEGEAGTFTGDFAIGSDPAASAGFYAHSPAGSGAGDHLNHSAVYTVNITRAGVYKINASVFAAATSQNSFFAQIDNGTEYIWDIPASNNYVNDFLSDRIGSSSANRVDIEVLLTPGTHTLTLYFREAQARVDWIEFVLQTTVLASQ